MVRCAMTWVCSKLHIGDTPCRGGPGARDQASSSGNEGWRGALGPRQSQRSRKKVYNRPPQEECLELAEACLIEAERTLDREVAEMFLLKAGRYLEDAKRIMAARR
jgi:hypothetical protein